MIPLLVPLLVLTAGAVVLYRRLRPTAPTLGAAPVASTPNGRLLAAALELVPTTATELKPPDLRWDAVLGGRRGDVLGAPSWGYFAVYIGTLPDGTKKKGGTTCEIVASCCAGVAGWPRAWINRRPDDPLAPGDGFVPGAAKAKIERGAREAGWLREVKSATSSAAAAGPAVVAGVATSLADADEAADLGAAPAPPALLPGAPDVLLPGDYYCTLRPGATYNGQPVDGSHVGVVKEVGPPNEQGERVVWTIDGGQTCACADGPCQCAKQNRRVLRPDGWLVGPTGVAARLAWVIRAPVAF